jgi:hypothetical protein
MPFLGARRAFLVAALLFASAHAAARAAPATSRLPPEDVERWGETAVRLHSQALKSAASARFSDALADLEAALRLAPRWPEAWVNAGATHVRLAAASRRDGGGVSGSGSVSRDSAGEGSAPGAPPGVRAPRARARDGAAATTLAPSARAAAA